MKVFLILSGGIIILASCRSTRKIQSVIAVKDSAQVAVLPPKADAKDSASVIREKMTVLSENLIDYSAFSARVDVDYQGSDGKKYDVNAILRMQKDSAIWISIGKLGFEGLRAFITKDSVKILNKQDKVYTARSVAYLQEVTALPLDLHTLQDILIGNPVFLDSNIVSYSKNGNSISLLSIGTWFKNLLSLNAEGRMENSKLDDVDITRSRTCNLSYADYDSRNAVAFSTRRRITVAEKSSLDIKLAFKSWEFNETLSFPFPIPKNYTRN